MTIHTGALLEDYVPRYDFASRHEIETAAPIERLWNAMLTTDISALPSIRFLFLLRGMRLKTHQSGDLLDQIRPYGFLELAARQYQEIVIGAIGKPWRREGGLIRNLDTERYLEFNEPGYVRIGANLLLTAIDKNRTRIATETRIQALDRHARTRFAAYWTLIQKPSGWIRMAMLRNIADRA
jgi:hypothetical protein